MLIKHIAIPKAELVTITEKTTIEEALHVLEKSGFRCIPILDQTGTIFRGNIYKINIYKHMASNGDMHLPVTFLAKNFTKFIDINDSFFKVFFTIKELPYIAILDEQKNFYGILTHNRLLSILEQAWNVDNGGYVLTIQSLTKKGQLAQITKIISRYTSILNCITLDEEKDDTRRTIITLPESVDENIRNKIIQRLNRKNFKVLKVESLKLEE